MTRGNPAPPTLSVPLDLTVTLPEAAKLREKIRDKTHRDANGCWIWLGYINPDGYGRIVAIGEQLAHRVSYRIFHGPISDGLQIDHLCRNRACVNPEHLEAVTQHVNILRSEGIAAKRARQTHCIHGHPFSADNTYRFPNGRRACRTCRTEQRHRYYTEKGQ